MDLFNVWFIANELRLIRTSSIEKIGLKHFDLL